MGVERATCLWSERALEQSDIGVLVVDAERGWETQDTRLLDLASRQLLRCAAVAFNKWDLVHEAGDERRKQGKSGEERRKDPQRLKRDFEEKVRRGLPAFQHVPFFYISAHTGAGVRQLVDACVEIVEHLSLIHI